MDPEHTGQYRPRLERIQLVADLKSDMAGPARRDLVWDACLRAILQSPAEIRLRDVMHLVQEPDVSDRTVRRTMNAMRALGWLRKEKEGGHYYLPGPKAVEFLRLPGNRPGADVNLEATTRKTERAAMREEPEPEPIERVEEDDVVDDRDEIERALDQVHIPGDGVLLDRRREVLEDLLEFLREQREARVSDLKEEFYSEETSVGYGDANSWWKNFIYPAFDELDLVETGGEGSHRWFYVGEE